MYIIKFSTKILQIDKRARLVPLFEQQFSYFKYIYTHFFIYTYLKKLQKNYKNLISNYFTKHPQISQLKNY